VTSVPLELQYRPPIPWHRTRQARRLFILTATLIALTFGAYYGVTNWPAIRRTALQLYWERQCRNYSVPSGTITYSDDPQDVSKLAGTAGYVTGGYQGLGSGSFVLAPNQTFLNLVSAQAGRKTLVAPSVFLHGRQTPSGSARLVAVQLGKLPPPDPYNRLFFDAYVHHRRSASSGQLEMCLAAGDRVRIYEGQPDSADATHFTIDYDLNGQRGTIDGNLDDNGFVTFAPRSGKYVDPSRTEKHVIYHGPVMWSPGGAAMPQWVDDVPPPPKTWRER
jgi:hypothetical protein